MLDNMFDHILFRLLHQNADWPLEDHTRTYLFLFVKGIPKLRTNFWPKKRIHIKVYLVLTNKKVDLFSQLLGFFVILKHKLSSSRRSTFWVKEKRIGDQRELRWGSRRNALNFAFFQPNTTHSFWHLMQN